MSKETGAVADDAVSAWRRTVQAGIEKAEAITRTPQYANLAASARFVAAVMAKRGRRRPVPVTARIRAVRARRPAHRVAARRVRTAASTGSPGRPRRSGDGERGLTAFGGAA